MSNTPNCDDSDEFRLSEPVEISGDVRGAVELPPPKADEDDGPAAERQFSLRELFGLMTFAAVLFSGFQWLPPGWMALGLGIAACVSLGVSGWFYIRRPSIILAWWIVLFTYIGACVIEIRRLNPPPSTPPTAPR